MFKNLIILALFVLSCKSNDDIVDMAKLFEMTNVPYDGQMYAGYLKLDAETEFYYYFFTSTAANPKNAPLVLWFNGGPGCSSLQGALNEHGPFVFPKGSIQFVENPYAWTTLANVIYLESPAGVGFSKGKIPTNDDTAADQNLLAVKAFFAKYPDYANNEFYLSGESYAGVYIPLLANLLIGQIPSFKGFIIGNACTDITECSKLYENYPIHRIDYAGRNNLISDVVYREFLQQQYTHQCDNPQKLECMLFTQAAMADVFKVAFNPYNIYDKCYKEQGTYDPNARFFKADDVVDCTDSKGMREFLINRKDYLRLTHVEETSTWVECSKEYDTQYTILDKQSYYLYEELIKAGLRIWIFSGDIDAVVPITGTLFWINKLQNDYQLPTIEQWRPWFIPAARPEDKHQNAGNVLMIDGLTFVSVRGAGHMVPSDQAQAAHIMLRSFLMNSRLPK